jgi:hypothetical protein
MPSNRKKTHQHITPNGSKPPFLEQLTSKAPFTTQSAKPPFPFNLQALSHCPFNSGVSLISRWLLNLEWGK